MITSLGCVHILGIICFTMSYHGADSLSMMLVKNILPGLFIRNNPHQILELKTNEHKENLNIVNLLVKNIIRRKLFGTHELRTKTTRKSPQMKHLVMFHRIGMERNGWLPTYQ